MRVTSNLEIKSKSTVSHCHSLCARVIVSMWMFMCVSRVSPITNNTRVVSKDLACSNDLSYFRVVSFMRYKRICVRLKETKLLSNRFRRRIDWKVQVDRGASDFSCVEIACKCVHVYTYLDRCLFHHARSNFWYWHLWMIRKCRYVNIGFVMCNSLSKSA